MITLKQYAERLGKEPSGLRRKAEQGGFETARKIGRDWMIDENEPYIDRRVKTMQDWKKDVVCQMEAAGLREISLYEIARGMGIKHIKTQDARDILNAFVKRNPTYRIVKMYNSVPLAGGSLFTNGTVTELEYD